MKILPTERLAKVASEGVNIATELQSIRVTVAQVVRDWGIMPDDARLASLREVLDKANTVALKEIPEAIAYLKVNGRHIQNARNRKRKERGLAPSTFDLGLPELDPGHIKPTFTLEEIEAKLGKLGADDLLGGTD